MKILILGSNGFIGNNFNKFLQNKNCQVITINRDNCNLLNKDSFYVSLKQINPNYIINCAGYTGKPNVDACEINKESCWQGNVTIAKYLSDICNTLNIKYIQILWENQIMVIYELHLRYLRYFIINLERKMIN